jgi:hypothetical protein
MTIAGGLPDFLILGAPKAGTTAIYHALRQRPDVFMPRQKELRFFAFAGAQIAKSDPVNRKAVTDLETYRLHFSDAKESQLKGEASPAYLSSELAPGRIRKTVPEARMIAILRNPVDRAFSHFLFAIQQGYEPRDAEFLDALREPYIDHRGFRRKRPYVADSSYGKSLSRYFRIFDRDQIQLLRYEELKAEPERILKEIFDFLRLGEGPSPTMGSNYAASGIPRNATWHALLKSRYASWPLKSILGVSRGEACRAALIRNNLYKPVLSEEERLLAYDFFAADIETLEGLVGWDCGGWKP